MNRWRYPSLSIHGIEGAFADPGSKTVIPRKVIGKFSVRLVPNQDPVEIEKLINKYLNDKWTERGSNNKMTVSMNTLKQSNSNLISKMFYSNDILRCYQVIWENHG